MSRCTEAVSGTEFSGEVVSDREGRVVVVVVR